MPFEDEDVKELKQEVSKAVEPVMTAFEQFKKTNDERLAQIEKRGAEDPVTVDKLTKIETSLSAFEGLNQKLTQLEAQQKALDEVNEQTKSLIAEMDKRLGRPQSAAERLSSNKDYFNNWSRGVVDAYYKGEANLSKEYREAIEKARDEYKALNVGTDTAGGYLAPVEYVREIIKGVTELSAVRSLVRVRQTSLKSLEIPKRTGQFAAVWVAEQGTRSETTGLTYGLEEIPCHEVYALVDISQQMLEDSAFDMEAEIRAEATEQFEVAEGAAVVSGATPGKPEGFMTNSDVGETNSGAATAVAADGMLSLKHAIKTAYSRNATWVMNRTTIGSVRKLKASGTGEYVWVPGIASGRPNTIDGDPYVELPDMPNEGAGLYPVAYGDFRRAYLMVDRISMQLLRDPYTQATSGNIRFIMRRRVGGQVVLAEAIRKLKCST